LDYSWEWLVVCVGAPEAGCKKLHTRDFASDEESTINSVHDLAITKRAQGDLEGGEFIPIALLSTQSFGLANSFALH